MSFESHLDPTQWSPYNGYDYVSYPDLIKVGKGRRKKKRLKGDMDVTPLVLRAYLVPRFRPK